MYSNLDDIIFKKNKPLKNNIRSITKISDIHVNA